MFLLFESNVSNIISLCDNCNKDNDDNGDKDFKYFKIIFIFYVILYFGRVGLSINIFFINLCINGCELIFILLSWINDDSVFFVVFI